LNDDAQLPDTIVAYIHISRPIGPKPVGCPMVTISDVELRRQFTRCRELALTEPVTITYHGQESLLMLSADAFKRLKSLDMRQAFYA
jgi:hypothetical protein